MSLRKYGLFSTLPRVTRPQPPVSQIRSITSTAWVRFPIDGKAKSQEPLAQQLNIDDPASGGLREKTQAAQSESENTTEPPTGETSGPAAQPTQEPVAQSENKDEPPPGGLRGQTREAMARSENTTET